jgi:hypothetical protein
MTSTAWEGSNPVAISLQEPIERVTPGDLGDLGDELASFIRAMGAKSVSPEHHPRLRRHEALDKAEEKLGGKPKLTN